jgi:hypothetical protein
VSAETLRVPCRALLELLAVAEPCTLAVGRLDAAHGLAFNVQRAHLGGRGVIHAGCSSSRSSVLSLNDCAA